MTQAARPWLSRGLSIVSVCWKTLAVLLVLFALMVSLVRSLLPQVEQVHQQLVQLLEREFQLKVELASIQADWQSHGPELRLVKLAIPKQDGVPLSLEIDNVQVKLNFWQSLINLEPRVQDVSFNGVKLALDTDALALSQPQQKHNADWLYSLLLGQLERYSITNLQLDIISRHRHFNPIHIDTLNWRNRGDHHLGQGVVYLDSGAKEQELLSLRVDINGDSRKPDSLVGEIYAVASDLNLAEWAATQANPYQPDESLPLSGVVNFEAWLAIKGRAFGNGLVDFGHSNLRWNLAGKPQDLAIKQGQLQWIPNADGWQFFSHNLDLFTNKQPWPQLDVLVSSNHQGLHAQLATLEPALLLPLLPLVPNMDLASLLQYQRLAPQGQVSDIVWQSQYQSAAPGQTQSQSQPWQLSLKAKQLGWNPSGNIPGINSVSFDVSATQDTLALALAPQPLTLDYPALFSDKLNLNVGATNIHYGFASQSVTIADIALQNAEVSLNAALQLDLLDTPNLALAATVSLNDAAKIKPLLPADAMGQELADYLADALRAGESHEAQVVWQGAFSDYPFSDNQGKFQTAFTLDKAEFAFQPDWPAVTDIRLDALFDNDRMDLWLRRGKILQVDVSGAHIAIPELGERSLVEITADVKAKAQDATAVMLQSPLHDSVGETLKVVQVQGDVSAKLDLAIPIYDEEPVLKGIITLNKVPVYLKEPGLQLDDVSATLAFENDVVTGNKLTAKLFGQPLQFDIATKPVKQDYALDVKLAGQWQLAKLPPELHTQLAPYYQGNVNWNGKLGMVFDDSGYRIQANIKSDLRNTQLTLPAPLVKAKGEKLILTAEFIGDNQESHLGIKLGKLAEFWGGFNAKSGKNLAYYDLMLGRNFKLGQNLAKQQGAIWLDLDNVDLAPWLEVIDALSQGRNSNVFPPLEQVQGKVKQLTAFGQLFENITVNAKPVPDSWQMDVDSDALAGTIHVYPDWLAQGVKLSAQHLYLTPVPPLSAQIAATNSQAANTSRQTAPLQALRSQLPPIALDVNDFRYQDKQLGHLVLQGAPSELGYQIQTVSLTAPGINLRGNGVWHNTLEQNTTELDVTLKAKAFDLISDRLQIDPGVQDAPLSLAAKLNWHGSPFDLHLDNLNGAVSFDMGKGHLSQVSDKGARIFSLFSLDSLLRKLSFDFSDVFGQGLYFNAFSGNLKIDNGVVKTTDSEMDAIAGNMKVRGYTDLATESLNYDIRFVPQLASSVPTVVLLSTSAWTMGVGAFALTKVLEPVIEVIAEIRFRVSGTMSDPKIDELERKSKEIVIPDAILSTQPLAIAHDGMAPKDSRAANAASNQPNTDGRKANESQSVTVSEQSQPPRKS
ncbi:TIGR02099 family protein [Shewanella sp. SNU WT4]|uniref:YhdP family protein n=1 Tax=Shewanella sp. SNU WT4 TaxID=2590015 RepID=UPI00112A0DB7|nr:YhdP family protein [Shewanella sp. SNU WT4]QDF68300.1 TIGR02099 family protein [Shewanella sp. SNU WT4]